MAQHTKSSKNQNADQAERFRKKAHEIGCDDDEAAFDKKLKRIVPNKKSGGPEWSRRKKEKTI